MPPLLYDLLGFLGFLLRALGFFVAGLALGRLVLDSIKGAVWQAHVALVLGLFGLLIAVTVFATAGSSGAFALGAGIAYFWSNMPKNSDSKDKKTD
jgi:hypothetical protein